jgi:hypothetical protein
MALLENGRHFGLWAAGASVSCYARPPAITIPRANHCIFHPPRQTGRPLDGCGGKIVRGYASTAGYAREQVNKAA